MDPAAIQSKSAKTERFQQKVRFAVVGAINTALDFGLFLILGLGGVHPIVANYISTTAAMTFSFFANKKYTFRAQSSNYFREITLFLIFTLFGLWVLQPLVIVAASSGLEAVELTEWMILLGAKLAATAVSLVWNYVTYSRFVFRNPETRDPTSTAKS